MMFAISVAPFLEILFMHISQTAASGYKTYTSVSTQQMNGYQRNHIAKLGVGIDVDMMFWE